LAVADKLKTIWPFLYPVLCVVIPCLLYRMALHRKGQGFRMRFWTWVFILYLFVALDVAGIGSIWDLSRYDRLIRMEEINLHPFAASDVMTYGLNILLFVPLGFLLCLIWQDYENMLRTLLAGLFFSLLIEGAQLFNGRYSDIDDLIMNVAGAAVGYALAMGFKGLFKVRSFVSRESSALEPLGYIFIATLGEFLLYNMRWAI